MAHLTPIAADNAPDLATWRRDSPLKGTEYWPLGPTQGGAWQRSVHGSGLLQLDRDSRYGFWATTSNGGGRTDFMIFHYSDLAGLPPGKVIVEFDTGGNAPLMKVIPMEELSRQKCGRNT